MIFVAIERHPRTVAGIGRRLARNFLLPGACAVLAACNAEPPAGDMPSAPAAAVDAPEPEAVNPAAGEEAAGELLESEPDCPVLESRDWSAGIEDGGNGRRLHVSGEIDLRTPGFTVSWSEGPADRAMPPAQHLILELTPPDGMVSQVITSMTVDYEGAATYPEYRAILVRCGNTVLASITDIAVAD